MSASSSQLSTPEASAEKFYSKKELLDIYRGLQKRTELKCPIRELPGMLQRVEKPLSLEFGQEEKWILFDSEKEPFLSVLTRQQVKNQIRASNILPEYQLLPWSLFEKHSMLAADVSQVFQAQDKVDWADKRKEYKSLAVKRGQVRVRRLVETGLTARSSEMKAAEMNEEEVYYEDRKGKIQGPFSPESMLDWWKNGLLPEKLRIAVKSRKRNFTYVNVLLGRWFTLYEQWYVPSLTSSDPSPVSLEHLIDAFLIGKCRHDDLIAPWTLQDSKRGLPLLFLLVHYLPWSDRWLVTDTQESDSLSVRQAYELWSEEYGSDGNELFARPCRWNCNLYISIESLLDAYGMLE